MIDEIRELYRYRNLLFQLVVRDLKVRYKNSVLGFFWSLANPLVYVATITIMIKYLMRFDLPNYSAYLLAGFLPWVFFMNALLDSSDVILHHRELLRRVYFPREVLPLSVVVSNLIHFLLALLVFFAYLIIYIHFILDGTGVLLSTLWLPVLILMQCALIVGLTFFICTFNVYYEDTKYILNALLGVLFYVVPVMYPSEYVLAAIQRHNLPEILYRIYLLNPINILADTYKKILLPMPDKLNLWGQVIAIRPVDYLILAIAAVICLATAIAGYAYFNKHKWIFAERA